MRQIEKNPEPAAFIQWKKANEAKIKEFIDSNDKSGDNLWSLLPSSLSKDLVENDYAKSQLRKSLLTEQYYLCCYCNDSIKGQALDTKVEHFLPKETHKHNVFDYQNLLAACNGGERVRPVELSCDSFKGKNSPLAQSIIAPLTENGHQHFAYRENGEMMGTTIEGKNTIAFLNLNCDRLRLLRKVVIEAYIYDETSEIETLLTEVLEPIDGKLQAFCMAIVYILQSYR